MQTRPRTSTRRHSEAGKVLKGRVYGKRHKRNPSELPKQPAEDRQEQTIGAKSPPPALKTQLDDVEDDVEALQAKGSTLTATLKEVASHDDAELPASINEPFPEHLPKALTLPSEFEALFPLARLALLQRLARSCTQSHTKDVPYTLKEYVEATQTMFDRTVRYGEGNNMVIWGPPGSGKSMVVDIALAGLQSQEEGKRVKSDDYTLVRLNGIVHSTDRAALRDIARQLDPSVFVAMNTAETSEDTQEEVDMDGLVKPMAITSTSGTWGSFAETFEKILRLLSVRGDDTHQTAALKPIIFVLDNIELFAEHPRQSLLYTLFDLAQNGGGQTADASELSNGVASESARRQSRIPVAVIGMTCRIDFLDLLEKRVKSRFSHRILKILPLDTVDDLIKVVISQITLNPADCSLTNGHHVSDKDSGSLCREWNTISPFFWRANAVRQILSDVFDHSKNIARIFRLLRVFLSTRKSSDLTVSRLSRIMKCDGGSHKIGRIKTCSGPCLLLLIAIKHLVVRGFDYFNFEMAYTEYLSFADSSAGAKKTSKPLAIENASPQKAGASNSRALSRQSGLYAFEQLLLLELLLLADTTNLETSDAPLAQYSVIGGNTKQDPEYRMCRALFEPVDIERAVDELPIQSNIKTWAKEMALVK